MATTATLTMGTISLLEGNADPNGTSAAKGSIAIDSTNGQIWQNSDGSTTWVRLVKVGE